MPLAVAALPAVIIAVVALILLYGLALLLRSILQGMSQHIPYVGGALSSAIGSIIDDAISLGAQAARSAVSFIIGIVMAPVYWIEQHITSIIQTFESVINAVAYITGTLIPQTIAGLRAEIQAAESAALNYAHNLAIDLTNLITTDVTQVYHELAAVQASLISYANTLFTDAEHYTQAAITAETAYVNEVASELTHELQSGLAATDAYVTSAYNSAIHYTQSAVASAEAAAASEISSVTAWVGTEVTALQAYIAAVGASAIAFTTEAVGVVEADLGNLKSDCTDNLCSGLSDLASLFNGLTGDLGLAALFALAARFAADPPAAAAEVESTLGPIARDAAGAVRSLVGV